MNVFITGASGFIGRNLCISLKKKGYCVWAGVRDNIRDIIGVDKYIEIGYIGPETDWDQALTKADVVIHLAAKTHIMHEITTNPIESFRKINVLGTECLARAAVKAGVKRFIFISSVKVNGEGALQPYTENDYPKPEDAYSISKLEAENVLSGIAAETGLQIVILRLPLVYGQWVKANFLQLIRLIDKNTLLPFGSISNRRSFIYVGNLCDIIELCLVHPGAARQLFLVSDKMDISTPRLISMIAEGLKKKVRLFSCPVFLLRIIGLLIGKSAAIRRLADSLCVQTKKLQTLTGWKPRFSVEEGIAQTVDFYKHTKNEKHKSCA